jgi:hypothetical protein
MAARSPAGQRIWLSHNGAEGVDPLVVEKVELVQVIISLVLDDLLHGICCESTDFQDEFVDDILHWDAHRKCDDSCHGQVDSLGQQAGLCQVGLPSRLWQAKVSLWYWSRRQSAVFECTKASLGLRGKHTTSKPIVAIPTLPPPIFLGHQITFATIKQTWV